MEVICLPDVMVRRHMVRGFNEKVFYFERQDNEDRLMQLEIDSQNKDKIKIEKKEVW